MGKLVLIFAAFIAATAVLVAANEEQERLAFVKIFNEMHQDPFATENVAPRANVETLWIEQKLDHFDPSETRIWQMVSKTRN